MLQTKRLKIVLLPVVQGPYVSPEMVQEERERARIAANREEAGNGLPVLLDETARPGDIAGAGESEVRYSSPRVQERFATAPPPIHPDQHADAHVSHLTSRTCLCSRCIIYSEHHFDVPQVNRHCSQGVRRLLVRVRMVSGSLSALLGLAISMSRTSGYL